MTPEQQKAIALANARLRLQKPEPTLPERIAGNPITRVAIGAAEPILGAAQLAANAVGVGEPVNEHLQQLDRMINAGRGDSGFDAARFAGNVISPVNAGLAKALPAVTSTAGRAGVGAGAGAVGGATMPVTQEDGYWGNKGAQVATGATFGAVLTPVIGKVVDVVASKVNAIADRFRTRTPEDLARASLQTDRLIEEAISEIGGTTADIPPQMLAGIRQEVNEALKSGKKLDAAALFRRREFEALGVDPTLGQITRDPTQFARERNLRAADPRLTVRFNDQSRRLAEQLRNYGQSADEPQAAGQRFIEHLANLDRMAGREVTKEYQAARQSSGRDLDVPLQGVAQDLQRVATDYGSSLPDAIRSKLASFGILDGKQTKVFTVNDAELLLQQANKLRGNDRATNNALNEVTAAIKRAVLQADDQGGAFSQARSLAAKRFTLQDLVPALKASADGDASADKFVGQFLLRGETQEVQRLAKLLRETSPDLFQQARGQFGQEIMRAAYGENLAGDKALRPEMLAKVLRQFGTDRLKAFFEPAEIAQLQRIARVGAFIESPPAAAPVNTSNTLTAGLPFLAQLPGAEKLAVALRAGAAIGRNLGNERAVTNALGARVPETSAAELSPEARRLLAKALVMGGAGAGMATASDLK